MNHLQRMKQLAGILNESVQAVPGIGSNEMATEARVPMYHTVFIRNEDGTWGHYFDADDKEDARLETYSLKNRGEKTLVLIVPKDQARWNEIDVDAYVKDRLAQKQAKSGLEESDLTKTFTAHEDYDRNDGTWYIIDPDGSPYDRGLQKFEAKEMCERLNSTNNRIPGPDFEDEINELKGSTLSSYIKGASRNAANNMHNAAAYADIAQHAHTTDSSPAEWMDAAIGLSRKSDKRLNGISKASDRLASGRFTQTESPEFDTAWSIYDKNHGTTDEAIELGDNDLGKDGWFIARHDNDEICAGPYKSMNDAMGDSKRLLWFNYNKYYIDHGVDDNGTFVEYNGGVDESVPGIMLNNPEEMDEDYEDRKIEVMNMYGDRYALYDRKSRQFYIPSEDRWINSSSLVHSQDYQGIVFDNYQYLDAIKDKLMKKDMMVSENENGFLFDYAEQDGRDFYNANTGKLLKSYPELVKNDMDLPGAKLAREQFLKDFPGYKMHDSFEPLNNDIQDQMGGGREPGDVEGWDKQFEDTEISMEDNGGPAVHEFDNSKDAYDASQMDARYDDDCNEIPVKTGDILIIPSEGVVGVSDTWPTAVTKNTGSLHGFEKGHRSIEQMAAVTKIPAETWKAAMNKAQELGFDLATDDDELEEDFNLNNGYDDINVSDAYDDYFPTGADSPVVKSTGPSGARQGDNPEQKKMQIAEVHKELVYGYRNYLKESISEKKRLNEKEGKVLDFAIRDLNSDIDVDGNKMSYDGTAYVIGKAPDSSGKVVTIGFGVNISAEAEIKWEHSEQPSSWNHSTDTVKYDAYNYADVHNLKIKSISVDPEAPFMMNGKEVDNLDVDAGSVLDTRLYYDSLLDKFEHYSDRLE